ncbi:MAG: type II secretion system protein [Verrucomicrobia bacterium]|nr:type II secretion system protein [Verrucomicrobiota bacterium]
MTRSTLAIPQTISSSKRSGFTLTEILTVVTIVVILLGILIPSILSVQRKAKRVESEALFGKLITAFTLYRKDHGAYPDLSGSLKDGDVVIDLNNPDQWSRFAEIMALSNNDGSALENPENKTLIKSFNPKLKRYFDLQLSELEKVSGADRLVDAFGNPHIYVVVDANLDGKIGRSSLPGSEPKDLRQRIVVYTVDENDDDFLEMKSWDS